MPNDDEQVTWHPEGIASGAEAALIRLRLGELLPLEWDEVRRFFLLDVPRLQ
jgi:hypothetical protein